jgi:hypothetical protein
MSKMFPTSLPGIFIAKARFLLRNDPPSGFGLLHSTFLEACQAVPDSVRHGGLSLVDLGMSLGWRVLSGFRLLWVCAPNADEDIPTEEQPLLYVVPPTISKVSIDHRTCLLLVRRGVYLLITV